MTRELNPEKYGIAAEDLARTMVVGETILSLIGPALETGPAESLGIGYYRISQGATHFGNGAEITPEMKTNYSAGNVILSMPEQVTMSSRKNGTRAQRRHLLRNDPSNPFVRPAVETLIETGLYRTEKHPSVELHLVAPALRQYYYGVRYESLRELKGIETEALLPGSIRFKSAHIAMRHALGQFIDSLPKAESQVADMGEVFRAVENFDISTSAPRDISGASWDVTDMVRGVRWKTIQVDRYNDLRVENAAEYLTSLLTDVQSFAESLRS